MYSFLEKSLKCIQNKSSIIRKESHDTGSILQEDISHRPPSLMLPFTWNKKTNPKGFWWSEKFDGVRAFWNGRKLVSRLGNEFDAPQFFIKDLPKDLSLDGELWCGRGQFQIVTSIVRTAGEYGRWSKVIYKVFDAPRIQLPFEERMKTIKDHFEQHPSEYVEIVLQEICEGIEHLQLKLKEIEALGGEGIILKAPRSMYIGKRSNNLLKVKSFFDAEAKIVKYIPGTGKYRGLLGALYCDMENGKSFAIGSGLSDENRVNPPPIGSIITYRYQSLTRNGLPRFPSFVGVRDDVKWSLTQTKTSGSRIH